MAQFGSPATLLRPWKTLWIPALLCAVALGFEAYHIFHNLDDGLQISSDSPGKAIATLTSITREVRQKSNGTLIWQIPQDQQLVRQADAIATMENSEAILTFHDQSQLIVEADSLVIIEEAPDSPAAAGTGSRVVARLIKGSIKRKAGPMRPGSLLVKLSDVPNAEAIALDDETGNAIFRLVHRSHGLEIIVESGAVKVNQGRILKASESATYSDIKGKLPAPRLRKPKIEIKSEEPAPKNNSFFDFCLWPQAWAEEAPFTQVEILFDWEAVPGADQYLIQVSHDSDFNSVLVEREVKTTQFPYEFPSPKERMHFYFRVAAISADGAKGDFSEAQMVRIHPESTRRFSIEPETSALPNPSPSSAPLTVIPSPTATPMVVQPKPSSLPHSEPIPAVEKKTTAISPLPADSTEFIRTSGTTHFQLTYGAQYHQRTFRSESSPQSASGNGFIPARLGAELQFIQSDATTLTFGGNYLLETTRPKLSSPGDVTMKTPLYQGWAMYGVKYRFLLVHGGLYASSSTRIKTQGLTFEAQTPFLLGAAVGLASHPDSSATFLYEIRLAALGVGSRGADLMLRIERPLFQPAIRRLSEANGPVIGIELQGRVLKIETGFSTIFQAGYRFF